ncbi:MAG: fumarylacetoacetate hydrolase family protein [Planctomycetota bacterium]|nr:fumarylacetoacetate hydrolase family protein [Planctomycetota bacterium]
MRISRYESEGAIHFGFYFDHFVVNVESAALACSTATESTVTLSNVTCILDLLPPSGKLLPEAVTVWLWLTENLNQVDELKTDCREIQMLVPLPRPNKLLLLAGNYSAHVQEGGEPPIERAETFPYVFMKPASTTLTHPGTAIQIPLVSPNNLDWELELAVVIGRRGKHITQADAVQYIAGYTIINDISDRDYRPFPDRKERSRDRFFDWMHGKWHDGSCPCGPCIATPMSIPDPQILDLKLFLNGNLRQDSNTSQQVFPITAVIEFLSQSMTLEPGDIISTGTPAGVGKTTNTFLSEGDILQASISKIGTLETPVTLESG